MKRERITKQELETMRRIYRNGELPARILAEEIGVSENVFYRWMSGDRNPGYLVTARIRQFLKKHTFSDHADRLECKIEKGEGKRRAKRLAQVHAQERAESLLAGR